MKIKLSQLFISDLDTISTKQLKTNIFMNIILKKLGAKNDNNPEVARTQAQNKYYWTQFLKMIMLDDRLTLSRGNSGESLMLGFVEQ